MEELVSDQLRSKGCPPMVMNTVWNWAGFFRRFRRDAKLVAVLLDVGA